MSIREKAIESLVCRVLDYHFRYGEPTDPRYYGEREKAESTYEDLIRSMDWNRALIEAQSRHLAFGHEPYSEPCGERLREALLTTDTLPRWKEQAAARKREPAPV